MSVRNIFATAKAIHTELALQVGPPEEGFVADNPASDHDVARAWYLAATSKGWQDQINGAYEKGCRTMILAPFCSGV